ncbi:cell wall-binding repeat-containing protein [Kineococcus radiotolerans]|uniref:Cell wall binding repeat 2-containing protein n=1 Tax=Kineococcus radiotolerans (strain ATCC BAA-149 / DSM 14245 / SRS30216) TaxID=266940 RepID=A6WCE0_KINRD|nr:cell wall-binding repeat-containing protein [Kineococcus radiotolerans]ABS04479.1 putative cell wall binding repeat 2-containing protein [Kineococcus radiotolerans SRS30216 = ATCC BAA-149]
MFSTDNTRRGRRSVVALVLAGAAVLTAGGSAAAGTPVTAHRTYGADRYATAAYLENYASRDTAYIVTGEKFADGVTAGALAGQPGSNLFLTSRGQLPDAVRKVIGYYRNVVVVGGADVVSADVVTWLQQNTRARITRVEGRDRYETATRLSATAFSPGVSNVLVATGLDYADALSASAVAATTGVPVLTVPGTSIPESTRLELLRLAPQRITVLGGEASVSRDVAVDLQQFTGGPVERIYGDDRYQTAVAVSKRFFGPGVPFVQLASGTSWPDAIAAGAKAGRNASPLLLTPRSCVPQFVNLEIERLRTRDLQAVGGDASYSQAAAKRTSCEAGPKTYLDELAAPTGNARFLGGNVTMAGVFYPRTVAFSTYAPTNSSQELPNGEYRTWSLGAKRSRFTTVVGIADGTTSGLRSRVQVYGDERPLGTYEVSVGNPAVIDLDVRGVDNLKVVTTSSARSASDEDGATVFLGDAAVN